MLLKQNYLCLALLFIGISVKSQDVQLLAKKALNSTVSITMLNYGYSDKIKGSGFVVSENVIATNYHVISLGNEGYIQKSQTDSVKIPIKKIIAVDVENDLALLEVDNLNLPNLEISKEPLSIGEKIYVTGNPMGLSGTFSDGIISANRKLLNIDVIQITAPVSSGSSGGPVFNVGGKVVGVVFLSQKSGQNLNFVVPGEKLVNLLGKKRVSIKLNQPQPEAAAESDMSSIFVEKFTDAESGKIKGMKLRAGQQSILETNDKTYFAYNTTPYLMYKPDFLIQASIKTEPNGKSCLYWGDLAGNSSQKRMLYVFCQKSGSASLGTYVNDVYKKLDENKKIAKIRKDDFNLFKIHKKVDSLIFSINDEIAFKQSYDAFLPGQAGIGSEETGTKITIDFLEIKQASRKPVVYTKMDTTIKSSKLSDNINSKYNDLFPIISLDAETIYFTRYNSPKNHGKQMAADIYKAPLKGKLETMSSNSSDYNDEYDNYCFGLSNDGASLYIEKIVAKSERYRKEANLRTYCTENNETTDIPNFKSFYCYSDYSVYNVSSDEKTMVVSLKRADTFGESDLYVSHLEKDKSWSQLVNLGQVINTQYDEGAAFLTADNRYMIFCSEGHPGYGKGDLFISERLDSTWINWSEPMNLGSGINTKNHETYPYLCLKDNELYFNRYKMNKHEADIYKIKLPDIFHADVTLGKLNFEESNMDVEITMLEDKTTRVFPLGKRKLVNFIFDNHKKYSVKCTKDGKLISETSIDLSKKNGYAEESFEIKNKQ
jgi:hypothetical protein